MTKTSYHITLKPLDKYFFGGERNFDGGPERNHLIHSQHFPQQTALLGLLRYLLLLQAGNDIFKNGKIVNTQKAINRIGKRSFNGQASEKEEFGWIEKLYPLMLHDGKEYLYPVALNHGKALKFHPQEDESFVPKLDGYNPKKELEENLFYKGIIIPYEGTGEKCFPFIPVSQVGIRKSKKGVTEDNAFYHQTFYRLEKGLQFSFHAILNKDQLIEGTRTISFGGERSQFKISVKKGVVKEYNLPSKILPSDNEPKLVLLSDTFLAAADMKEYCRFAIAKTTPFRNLVSEVGKTKHYYNIGKDAKGDQMTRNQRFTLLKKGSVLYPEKDKVEGLKRILESSHFNVIGYNHFYEFKPTRQ